jgi:hypothetical protein
VPNLQSLQSIFSLTARVSVQTVRGLTSFHSRFDVDPCTDQIGTIHGAEQNHAGIDLNSYGFGLKDRIAFPCPSSGLSDRATVS